LLIFADANANFGVNMPLPISLSRIYTSVNIQVKQYNMIATKDKVGRADWKALKVGETGVFTLPNINARPAARVVVSHLRLRGYDFEPLHVGGKCTIAYRRTK
jgi:hypothetical protein